MLQFSHSLLYLLLQSINVNSIHKCTVTITTSFYASVRVSRLKIMSYNIHIKCIKCFFRSNYHLDVSMWLACHSILLSTVYILVYCTWQQAKYIIKVNTYRCLFLFTYKTFQWKQTKTTKNCAFNSMQRRINKKYRCNITKQINIS